MSDAQDIQVEAQVPTGAGSQPFTARESAPRGTVTRGAVTADQAPARPPLARLYMTSDLRAATGLARTHIDFYLREGLIQPSARTESGYLLFDDAELTVLREVIGLRQEGLGIREIRARIGR
jgi:hypothetical protein